MYPAAGVDSLEAARATCQPAFLSTVGRTFQSVLTRDGLENPSYIALWDGLENPSYIAPA